MFVSKLIRSILIVLISYLLLKFIQFTLKGIFKITKFDERYENTLCSVLCSVSYYIMLILAIILILREFGIVDATEFGSIVTGASIVGIVAGVASQSILKDVFNGFFIFFEKQIQVGDFIVINEEFRGSVEEIGISPITLTRLENASGKVTNIEFFLKIAELTGYTLDELTQDINNYSKEKEKAIKKINYLLNIVSVEELEYIYANTKQFIQFCHQNEIRTLKDIKEDSKNR